jgi:uncharacterized protein with GYD domain
MATFISLVNFTQQGIRDFKASADRGAQFKSMAEKAGATVKDIYWTMGSHDAVIVMEAPDDESAAAVMLKLGSFGNVTTQTLRAFTSSETKKIASKIPD